MSGPGSTNAPYSDCTSTPDLLVVVKPGRALVPVTHPTRRCAAASSTEYPTSSPRSRTSSPRTTTTLNHSYRPRPPKTSSPRSPAGASALQAVNQWRDTPLVGAHGGVLPVEQGEGDSFVAAFARASDAVACALELQRSPLAPIRLRIGVHTGETQLRDNAEYAGPMINRTARLRELAHGGQTSTFPVRPRRWLSTGFPQCLADRSRHAPAARLPRPERVVQLCHLDLGNEFPPLRTTDSLCRA